MNTTYLVRHSEIHLKGRNRPWFERLLLENIQLAFLKEQIEAKVENAWRRMFVTTDRDAVTHREIMSQIFGIASFSPIATVASEYSAILNGSLSSLSPQLSLQTKKRFRVSVNRVDKAFPLTSVHLEKKLGEDILARYPALSVDLKNFDLEVGVELHPHQSYLYTETLRGPGGLPVGSAEPVLTLLSGGIDSPVAAWLMMKRGCPVDFISFYSPPYTSPLVREKMIDLSRRLSQYQRHCRLFIVPFVEIQKKISEGAPETFRTLLYRRAMQSIGAVMAGKYGLKALVTGESIGQVASQTLPNLIAIEKGAEMTVLRPLIAFDKQETIALARKIGTYEISIRPFPDCCTLFQPKRPALRADLSKLRAVEEKLALAPLMEEAIDHVEMMKFK